MASKPVRVKSYKRSTPSKPSWKGPGNKPGPKPVKVPSHGRSNPK